MNNSAYRLFLLLMLIGYYPINAQQNGPMGLMNPDRNNISDAKNLPEAFDLSQGGNLIWVANLGSQAYGEPVVANGKVFIGTNNENPRNPNVKGDKGVMMAFEESTGKFLWQLSFDKLHTPFFDWPLQGIRSTPFIDGDKMFFLNNRTELVCADTEGFYDGEDDGWVDTSNDKHLGDIIWKVSLIDMLYVFPHNGTVFGGMNRPMVIGDLVYCGTNNGVGEDDYSFLSPYSPDLVAFNKNTGKLVWEQNLAGANNLHISASNPAYAEYLTKDGEKASQLIFPAGNGWLYGLNPKSAEIIWKFDCNPKDAQWWRGAGTKNNIIATPVIWGDKVYIGVGQDADHGEGNGNLLCIDLSLKGDVTEKAVYWRRSGEDFHRTVSSVVIADSIIYATDLSGFLYALDANTGEHYWTYDAFAAIWSGPLVADGKVYLGDEDGDIAILKTGKGKNRKPEIIGEFNVGSAVYGSPVVNNSVLFICSRNKLFAFGK